MFCFTGYHIGDGESRKDMHDENIENEMNGYRSPQTADSPGRMIYA